MTDREQLIAELRQAHGIQIDPDDPIFIAVLLNQRLLNDSLAAVEMTVRVSADRITAASIQHLDAAKQSASVLITEAGEWSAARLQAATSELADALSHQLQQQTARAERASRLAMTAARFVSGVCAIVIAGAAGFVLAGFGRW